MALMNAISMSAAKAFGTMRAGPIAVTAMQVRIGLRTRRNGPVVTRAVRASGSTSARHESPIDTCAAIVPAMPSTATTSPAYRSAGWSSGGKDSTPSSSAIGAAKANAIPTAETSRAHRCGEPGASRASTGASPVPR
jgi:hypothetical protein